MIAASQETETVKGETNMGPACASPPVRVFWSKNAPVCALAVAGYMYIYLILRCSNPEPKSSSLKGIPFFS